MEQLNNQISQKTMNMDINPVKEAQVNDELSQELHMK